MKIALEQASVLEEGGGDYYQVLFTTRDENEDDPYVLIQRQFEDPDGGVCYLETHDLDTIGHGHVVRAVLSHHRFRVRFRRREVPEVDVIFRDAYPSFAELRRILAIMMPCLEVHAPPLPD